MKTRIFTLLMAFLTMVGNAVWGQTQVSISTETELRDFAKRVNENTDNSIRWNVTLEANIDLGGKDTPWTPIRQFRGTFDGGNHIISGLYIENTKASAGFFERSQNGDIKNLTIQGEITNCTGYIGGFSGQHSGTMINCHNEVNITVNSFQIYQGTLGTMIVGGLSGNGATFENCTNSGNITINIPESSNGELIAAGGIAGNGGTYITNCYNSGTITINGNNGKVEKILIGGVMGQLNGKLENCYNTGNIEIKNLSLEGGDPYALIGGVIGRCEDFITIAEGMILHCYNTGNISIPADLSSENLVMVGGLLGASINGVTVSDSYYLKQENIIAIGFGSNTEKNVESRENSAFQDGTVAYELRKAGGNYGQDLHSNTPAESPTLLCFTPDDAVYKLTLNYESYDETAAAEQYANSGYLNLPELEENAGWYDNDGNLYTSESAISEDITLYAQKKTAHMITITDTEGGTVASDKTTAIVGETITLTVTTDEGYTFGGLSVVGTEAIETTLTGENIYTFTMPDADVTVTAQFTKNEEPTDPDEGDDEQGGIVPDAPKYYNIYEDEICEGVTLEFSRDVVKEGQSVLVTVTVDEEFDATDLTLKFKRALFGYWEDLTLTPTENPNEYIIENIYTDIYVRAEGAVPTGIESIESAKVYTKDGSIYVYTPTEEQVQIISASGAIVKNETQVGLKQYTGLQRGIYIICIDEARFKVRL